MADSAAWLVDRVFPWVPVRQWVLSVPFGLRYRMAFDAGLMADVSATFARVVLAELRRRARTLNVAGQSQGGAVTFVQRFGSALNLNVHFHMIALDGVYAAEGERAPVFLELEPPEDADVVRVATLTAGRILRLIERRGWHEEADRLWQQDPGLAQLYSAAVQGRIEEGPRRGQRLGRLGGDRIDGDSVDALAASPRCASVSGFSVHANTAIPAGDRQRLERLCRYAARPPLAADRLSRLTNGKLRYELKRPWSDGTTAVVFEPDDLLAKLAALVPAPRVHLTRFYVRFYGVLVPAAAWRPQISPTACAATPFIRDATVVPGRSVPGSPCRSTEPTPKAEL